jgi:hypothetical protein
LDALGHLNLRDFLAQQAPHRLAAQAAHRLLAQVAAVRQAALQRAPAQPVRAAVVTTAVASTRERLDARALMVKSLREWV